MNRFDKAIKTLELDRILAAVGELCELESSKERVLALRPTPDKRGVALGLKRTTDAKNLLAIGKKPSLYTHVTIPDIISRAKKGAVLTPSELLRVAGLLSSAASVKSFGEKLEEKNSLKILFLRLLPDKTLENEIKSIIFDRRAQQIMRTKMKKMHSKNACKIIYDLLFQKTTSNTFLP